MQSSLVLELILHKRTFAGVKECFISMVSI